MSMHSKTKDEIESILREAFKPVFLEVIDESAQHAGHREAMLHSSAGHFKVTMKSQKFVGESLISRHRMVYEKLDDLMKHRIHALSLNLLAIDEYSP